MKLIELFDSTESNIFRRISTLLALPWFDTEFADDLNVEYFLGHSGNKTTSVLVDRLIAADELLVDDGGHIVTDDEGDPMISDVSGGTYQENLARIIVRNFKKKWSAYHDSIESEYDPAIMESEHAVTTPNLTNESDSNTGSHTTSTATDDGTIQSSQGFNSTDFNPVSKSSGSVTTDTIGEFEKNHSKTTTKSTGTNTMDSSRRGGDFSARSRDYRELVSVNMMELIIHDVDRILTLPHYVKD